MEEAFKTNVLVPLLLLLTTILGKEGDSAMPSDFPHLQHSQEVMFSSAPERHLASFLERIELYF